MLGLGHGASHHRLLILLLLIIVDGLGGHLLLLLIVDLRDGCPLLLILILILQVAHAGVLHVLALDEEEVRDAKNDEDWAQNGQVNGIIDHITILE